MLKGKSAIVTGSTSGIGLGIARALAAEGANVMLNGLGSMNEIEAIRTGLEQTHGVQALYSPADMRHPDQIATMVVEAETAFGQVDILVNNAGIQRRAPLEDFDPDDWRLVIETNLTGVFLVAREFVRGMIARKRGKIINICSLMSEVGRPTIGAYTAAKGGVKMLTRAMTVEWARHDIQVNGIGPGYFITEMTRPLVDDEEFNSWICGRTPAGRWGDPAELVGTAVFLASSASNFVNGQVIYVDGGILAAL